MEAGNLNLFPRKARKSASKSRQGQPVGLGAWTGAKAADAIIVRKWVVYGVAPLLG